MNQLVNYYQSVNIFFIIDKHLLHTQSGVDKSLDFMICPHLIIYIFLRCDLCLVKLSFCIQFTVKMLGISPKKSRVPNSKLGKIKINPKCLELIEHRPLHINMASKMNLASECL